MDFDEIEKTGAEVREILIGDKEWFDSVINNLNETGEFQEGLIDEIVDYLHAFEDEEIKKLASHLNSIVIQDGPDNILNSIFYESNDDVDINTPTIQSTHTLSFEDDDIKDQEIDESDPKSYFTKMINDIKNKLQISYDLSYLLNKKHGSHAVSKWIEHSKDILNSLRIKVGGETVPNLKSSLSFKSIGIGECPLCYEDRELYQLYCGHTICKPCLIDEINTQIDSLKIPVCRQSNEEDNTSCDAEIMPNDVYSILNGCPDKTIQKYTKIFIKDQIDHDETIRPCPFCDSIITPTFYISNYFARCPNCCSVTCLHCHDGFHGPLTCVHKKDFFDTLRDKMSQLEEDQESWYFRERRLQAYRREHKQPVFKYFDDLLAEVKNRNNKADQVEMQKIHEAKYYIAKLNKDLNALKIKENQILNGNDSSKLSEVQEKIATTEKEISSKEGFLRILNSLHETKQNERKKDLFDVDTEKEYFINAVSNESKFDFFLDQYKNLVNDEAYKSLNVAVTDEETIKRSTKLCPKCHAPIEKSTGCNWMKCWCGFEFCYFCNEPWKPNHSDHHKCPKYDMMKDSRKTSKSDCGIDFNDMKDMNFYPPPMNHEKRKMYIRYNNLVMQYMNAKEDYEKVNISFLKTENDIPNKSIKDLPYNKMPPKNKLIKSLLMKGKSESSATTFANQIINTILFGKTIVMYGFPQMYYIMLQLDNANLFEYNLYMLDNDINDLINLINTNPEEAEVSTYEKYKLSIELQSKNILEDGEKY